MVFLARVILAAIDHNMHVFRPQATTRDGSLKFARKYSKRTKNWHAEPVKIEKDYKYWPFLLSNILRRRHDDAGSVRRAVARPVSHPKNLAPTISMKQPTPTEELVQFRLARFGLKKDEKKNSYADPDCFNNKQLRRLMLCIQFEFFLLPINSCSQCYFE